MSRVFTAWLVSFLAAATVCASARAGDLSRVMKLTTVLVPRKSCSPQIRASECVQKSPELALWDGGKKITPSAIGFVYIVEQNDGNRLLLSDLNEGIRGWVSPYAMIPLDQAEEYFSKQIQPGPGSAFAYLMRGVARFENGDLENAAADLDAALKLEPKNVSALIARAQLWQWRNRLDQAMADVSQAIEIDSRNSYAYVARGIFRIRPEKTRQSSRGSRQGDRAGLASSRHPHRAGDDSYGTRKTRQGAARIQPGHPARPQTSRRLFRICVALLDSRQIQKPRF